MSTVVQVATQSGTSGAATTATLANAGSFFTSGYGLIAVVRSQAGSSINPAPATPSGWTLVGAHASSQSGTFTVTVSIFARRGDGTVNSITVAAGTSTTRLIGLSAIDGVGADTFWQNYTSVGNATSVTTRSITVAAPNVGNTVVIAGTGLSGTTGAAAGFGWTVNGTTYTSGAIFGGTSTTSSFTNRYYTLGTAASTTLATTWTTSGLAAMAGAAFGGASAPPTISHTDTPNVCVINATASASNSGGTLTHALTPSTNVSEIQEGLFLVTQTDVAQFLTLTTTDSTSGVTPVTTDITVPAAAAGDTGLEIMVMVAGALE